jgi:hypothetical protein
MSYWFPILKETGVNVPRTLMLNIDDYDKNCVVALRKVFWMEELSEMDKTSLGRFIATMRNFADKAGYPLFLRSGHTSYKHEWLNTCYVPNGDVLAEHIQNIAEHSFMADMDKGWPVNVWALRRMIETEPIFTAFNGFPVTKEFRFFIRDGKVECIHPYWPEEAIEGHTEEPDWQEKLAKMNELSSEDREELIKQSTMIASKFEGWWSLDWLKGKDGKWYAIDMALGESSYHYPNCEHAPSK